MVPGSLIKTRDICKCRFTDETTVEMSANGNIFFFQANYMLQHLPSRKQKPKHAYKVHVCGGISYRGRTDICVFTGVMDSVSYQQILKNNFLPYVQKRFPDGYRLYQYNDSKHKSKSTVAWMTENQMIDNVMPCPAPSPYINAIENVWATMKDYLGKVVNGIRDFWNSMTAADCSNYIDHIQRVLPIVVLNDRAPSGF